MTTYTKTILTFLDIASEEAILKHNMAPLTMRRDMATLVLRFRIAHKQAPTPSQTLFREIGTPTEEEKQNMLGGNIQRKTHRMTNIIGATSSCSTKISPSKIS